MRMGDSQCFHRRTLLFSSSFCHEVQRQVPRKNAACEKGGQNMNSLGGKRKKAEC